MSAILSIDVAKLTLAVTSFDPHERTAAPDLCEHPSRVCRAARLGASPWVTTLHVCMEATNVYWEAIATWLHAQSYTVSVVNPARINGFGQSDHATHQDRSPG